MKQVRGLRAALKSRKALPESEAKAAQVQETPRLRGKRRFSRIPPIGAEVDKDRVIFSEILRTEGEVLVKKVRVLSLTGEDGTSGGLSAEHIPMVSLAVKEAGWRGRKIVFSAPSEQLVLRHVSLPKMPDKMLRKAIRAEIKNGAVLPFDNPQFDYAISPPNVITVPADGSTDVIVMAVPRSTVEPIANVFRMAGLRPIACEPLLLACNRLLPKAVFPRGIFGVLFIQPGGAEFGMFDGDTLVFLRQIEVRMGDYVREDEESGTRSVDREAYASDLSYELDRSLSFVRYNILVSYDQLTTVYVFGSVPGLEALVRRMGHTVDCEMVCPSDGFELSPESQLDLDAVSNLMGDPSVIKPSVGLALGR